MNRMSEDHHRRIAHDLPLLSLLLTHHCLLIRATYDPEMEDRCPLANQARKAMGEVKKLTEMMLNQAKKEHPGERWTKLYDQMEEYSGVWPPRISGQEADVE